MTHRRGAITKSSKPQSTGLSPWFVAELVRSHRLLALKPAGSRHYIILKEDVDSLLDDLREEAMNAQSI
jgi:hypothetical protein